MRRRPARTLAACLVAALTSACQTGTPSHSAGAKGPAPGQQKADHGWVWRAPSPASVGMPAADATGVAATYGRQHVVLLDGAGTELWDAARLGVRDVAPRLTADLVVVATDDGVAAFRRADGSAAWATAVQGRANTPVVAGRLAVVSTWEATLVGLDLSDGHVSWRAPLPGPAIGPAATDGTVVVTTWVAADNRRSGAVAVEAATGRQRWSVALPPSGVSAPTVVAGGLAVMVAGDLAAHALALDTGRERWRTGLDGAGSPEVPPLAVGDAAVLVAHRLGGLDLLETATGRRTWQVGADGAAVRGGPVAGPDGSYAFPLDDGRLLLAGPTRPRELVPAPARISGLAVGPGNLLIATIAGAAVNTIEATSEW